MKIQEPCPRCRGTITVTIRLADRADADTILAQAVGVHTDTCPTPATSRQTSRSKGRIGARDGDGTAPTVRPRGLSPEGTR